MQLTISVKYLNIKYFKNEGKRHTQRSKTAPAAKKLLARFIVFKGKNARQNFKQPGVEAGLRWKINKGFEGVAQRDGIRRTRIQGGAALRAEKLTHARKTRASLRTSLIHYKPRQPAIGCLAAWLPEVLARFIATHDKNSASSFLAAGTVY